MNRPALFVPGEFTSHSGKRLTWKIECDALTDEDWDGAAAALADLLPRFNLVHGVPRGGSKLARALRRYQLFGEGPVLIVDDVLTTGLSMIDARARLPEAVRHDAIGAVLFARGPCPDWVTPLFTLTSRTATGTPPTPPPVGP